MRHENLDFNPPAISFVIILHSKIQNFPWVKSKLIPAFNRFRALKDTGYQSDSTLVFKKKNEVEHLSPIEVKQVYKSVQLGGEVPLHGFRKQVPEKPKGE